MRYSFINPKGFSCILDRDRTIRHGKPIYHVHIHKPKGLMIYDKVRDMVFKLHTRYSDLSSVPKLLQWIPGFENWRWQMSAIAHDEAYKHGALERFGIETLVTDGMIYFLPKIATQPEMVKFSRCDADDMLASLILSEAELMPKWYQKWLGYINSPVYWTGVELFGWMSFMKKEKIT